MRAMLWLMLGVGCAAESGRGQVRVVPDAGDTDVDATETVPDSSLPPPPEPTTIVCTQSTQGPVQLPEVDVGSAPSYGFWQLRDGGYRWSFPSPAEGETPQIDCVCDDDRCLWDRIVIVPVRW